jgi:hypothetical protein
MKQIAGMRSLAGPDAPSDFAVTSEHLLALRPTRACQEPRVTRKPLSIRGDSNSVHALSTQN